VDEGVNESQKGSMATGKVLDPNEGTHGHQSVVVQVEEGDLALFLAQHKEHGVQQLRDLGNVVQPHGTSHLALVLKLYLRFDFKIHRYLETIPSWKSDPIRKSPAGT